jgi:hypothetical protein
LFHKLSSPLEPSSFSFSSPSFFFPSFYFSELLLLLPPPRPQPPPQLSQPPLSLSLVVISVLNARMHYSGHNMNESCTTLQFSRDMDVLFVGFVARVYFTLFLEHLNLETFSRTEINVNYLSKLWSTLLYHIKVNTLSRLFQQKHSPVLFKSTLNYFGLTELYELYF